MVTLNCRTRRDIYRPDERENYLESLRYAAHIPNAPHISSASAANKLYKRVDISESLDYEDGDNSKESEPAYRYKLKKKPLFK